jgi:membrane protease YdiL (CAAX protease family)
MSALPWIALCLAAPAVWIADWPGIALALLALGYAAALIDGLLGLVALAPIVLLLLAAYAVGPKKKLYLRYAGHGLFFLLALALSLHWLPGFHNPLVLGPIRFTPDAALFTMTLNLDKPLAGFWLLLALPWITRQMAWHTVWRTAALSLLMTAAVCLGTGMLLGTVAWAPKWPAGSGLWLLNNLVLVSVTEEALFRGYLQGGLGRLLAHWPQGETMALMVVSILFGLAHLTGGWHWALLGGIAGLGYGLAYRYGGLAAAVLVHFGLNTVHFFLFTYPMLQPAS